ncbi:MAG: GDP-L-fucose synthase [Acidobacteria bacterium]|nr:GDP-L-fucose synthase [Acidobacteriota bacterium]MBV9070997.1 GDP-L-fucose synthase [Acidobacteriota bacterium]MBV9184524.1 GDP-L-fucose synthase [Acidobacteriota bacterium]
MATFWNDRRILLTGGGGFLGGFIAAELQRRNPAAILTPRATELDLRDAAAVRAYLGEHRPNLVIHAAAVVGGIGANRSHPGRFFYDNAVMGLHLIEESRLAGVEKFVCLGTICAYPKHTPIPFREEELWNGYPEETNAPYGLAKKMLLVQLQAYRQEYGFNGIFLLPVNLYGPRDNFDLETSHVIPAMIRKFIEARERGEQKVVLWGDGSPTREFLYVEDAAAGVVVASEKYEKGDPVNVGSGEEISIRDLAQTIAEKIGFRGEIVWDATKPNGQPRRRLDVSRAAAEFGFRATTSMKEGMAKTIAWYEANR